MSYSHSHWRLILSAPADGAANMAADEAILLAVAAGSAPPTLRFFAWQPPCLSLGYAQPQADVDLDRLQALGWGLVRRPTGGRAILHTDELTYSVIASMAEPRVAGGILESYRQLSQGLLRGLELMGLCARADKTYALPGRDAKGAVCFETPSNYEITVADKKLLGSAQTRKQGVVLQHGTLPLSGDIARICEVLRFETEEARQLARARVAERATTVEAVGGKLVTWLEAARALAQGFSEKLNLTLDEAGLTPAERTEASQLSAEKYVSAEWNGKV
jgi:lipoyl(octanoyl) transferase